MKVDLSKLKIERINVTIGEDDSSPALTVRGEMIVYDMTTNKRESVIMRSSVMQAGPHPRESLKMQIRQMVGNMLLHELDECLFIDGKRLTDAHPEAQRTPANWQHPKLAQCDCPRSAKELEARAETYVVCDRAFADICDSVNRPWDQSRAGWIEVIPTRQTHPAFNTNMKPDTYFAARVRGGLEHKSE
jgi:hypothetical protein